MNVYMFCVLCFVFIRSPSVSFLVKMTQAFNEVVNRVCDLLSGHRLPPKSFVTHWMSQIVAIIKVLSFAVLGNISVTVQSFTFCQ